MITNGERRSYFSDINKIQYSSSNRSFLITTNVNENGNI